MSRDELAQYQEEWREEVRDRFNRLDESINEKLNDHEDRIRSTEKNQNKQAGALILLQGILTWVSTKFTNQ
jgi:hypothetical protein